MALTQEQLWAQIVRRSPAIEDGTKHLTARGAKKLFEVAWQKGFEAGTEAGLFSGWLEGLSNKRKG
jgi:hypothetical protein